MTPLLTLKTIVFSLLIPSWDGLTQASGGGLVPNQVSIVEASCRGRLDRGLAPGFILSLEAGRECHLTHTSSGGENSPTGYPGLAPTPDRLLGDSRGRQQGFADRSKSAPTYRHGFQVNNAAQSEAGPLREVALPSPLPLVISGSDSYMTHWRLKDFESLAQQHNPTLAMAEARLQAAKGNVIQSRAWPNPNIGYLGDEIGDEDAAGLQGMTFGIPVPNPWQRQANIEAAEWQLRQELYFYEHQRLRILGELKARYAAAYVAEKRVEVANQIFATVSKIVELVRERYEKGEVAIGELLQSQTSLELARINLESERAKAEAAWQALLLAAGVEDLPRRPLLLEEPLDPDLPDWEKTWGMILAQNPELLAAKAQVQAAKAGARAARRGRIPQVDVETVAKHHNPSGFNSITVGVSIPVPVFDRNRGNILAAEAAVREAEANVRRLELSLRQRLTALRADFEAAQIAARTYRERIIPQQQQAVFQLEEAYRRGQVHLVELLAAENTRNEAELEYWAAVEVLLQIRAELDVFLAGTDGALSWDR